ncbi:hypothetical protein O3677_11595 [Micrococcus luteus]|uniref:helix-turn-helix domain-containing protein n=1 Tax=Micrococcus TaxID=1269 RepID=UPI000F45E843|nr:hypothetical protein [Micrococcus sp. RIT608]MCV7546254.1 hypothetical protein [Micrococcus luteus]HAV0114458.1 hypothetical protein [Enterococcus faecium]MCV7600475.1 hypothetical protein [Micrococcus luteus]MCV7602833.1 hypothetical protein [Micrococcus luteus]MCV7645826.1 hypothetical protein [Micrococcus luteus]
MRPPRELLANPWSFGDSAPELTAESAGTALGSAAVAQSRIVSAVRARIGERGVSYQWVANRCGFSDRHLRRITAGHQWARLADVVALGQALETALILLPGAAGADGKRRVVRLCELG